MSEHKPYDMNAALDKALHDDFLRMATRRATDKLRTNKKIVTDELGNWEEWRQAGEKIRNHVVLNLDYYLNQLIENVEKNGGHVHLAKTPQDGVRIVQEIFKPNRLTSLREPTSNRYRTSFPRRCAVTASVRPSGENALCE
jgi:L-lactate dehydrogenase complex protein LldF